MKIKKLSYQDYEAWLQLYLVYAKHYKTTLSNDSIATTWSWLMDDEHPTSGIVAEVNGTLAGLAQFRPMPSPLRGHDIGFVDDIIVLPNFRGLGISEKLFQEIKLYGKQFGWKTIRWITRDDNYRARTIYDKIATKTDWNLYEMNCD